MTQKTIATKKDPHFFLLHEWMADQRRASQVHLIYHRDCSKDGLKNASDGIEWKHLFNFSRAASEHLRAMFLALTDLEKPYAEATSEYPVGAIPSKLLGKWHLGQSHGPYVPLATNGAEAVELCRKVEELFNWGTIETKLQELKKGERAQFDNLVYLIAPDSDIIWHLVINWNVTCIQAASASGDKPWQFAVRMNFLLFILRLSEKAMVDLKQKAWFSAGSKPTTEANVDELTKHIESLKALRLRRRESVFQ